MLKAWATFPAKSDVPPYVKIKVEDTKGHLSNM